MFHVWIKLKSSKTKACLSDWWKGMSWRSVFLVKHILNVIQESPFAFVMECFIHNMPAKEITVITEREEEKLFTDTNETWTLKRTKQEQKLCMIKNCWQHDERLTYWILEDYIDDVYQLSLASRKGGLYVERIQKRQNLKHKAPYYW